MIRDTLEYLGQGLDMTEDHAFASMNEIMAGQWSASQIAAFLMGLKMKGETVNEISGFVRAMRQHATKIHAPKDAIDTCGTGGDGMHSFNVSTAAAIVAAAAGANVAKHGNRSVSSKSGSADVLAALGVNVNLSPVVAEKCLHEIGIAFLFAPLYHASMKTAVEPRRDMGIRTVFNILGPMCNPAEVKNQVVGAFNLDVAEKMIKVLQQTGSKRVLLLHSRDGMDELSLSAKTIIFELKDGEIGEYEVSPEDCGLKPAHIQEIKGGEASENAELMKSIFNGHRSAIYDITVFNAGAAIYTAGLTDTLSEGAEMAKAAVSEGHAQQKLDQLIEFTNSEKGPGQ